MKTSIKIFLILIVALGIAASVYFFTQAVNDFTSLTIEPAKLETHVVAQCDKAIKGKSYDKAHKAYSDVLATITTEASITKSDGKKLITASDKNKALKVLVAEYAPILNQHAKDYFSNTAWDDNTLKALRGEAEELLSFNVIEQNTDCYSDCNYVINTVGSYYEAWNVANGASHCSTVDGISVVQSNVNKYLVAPLTNNSSLKTALNQAVPAAKNSVAAVIAAQCRTVAHSYASYSSYDSYCNKLAQCRSLISSYTNKYGTTTNLAEARSQLSSAENNAYEYFSSSYDYDDWGD